MSETVKETKKEKLSNREIVESLNRLNGFIEKDKDIPYKLYRAVVRNRKALMEEYKIYDEVRIKIMDKDTPEEEVVVKMEALLKETAEVDIEKVPESLLKELSMSAKDRIAIDFMVEEEE